MRGLHKFADAHLYFASNSSVNFIGRENNKRVWLFLFKGSALLKLTEVIKKIGPKMVLRATKALKVSSEMPAP